MAKDREKIIAKHLFVGLRKSQKETATIVNVSEKTMVEWVKEGNWKQERAARMSSVEAMYENGRAAVANLSDMLLDYQQERTKLAARGDKAGVAMIDGTIIGLTDAMAKASKSLNSFEKQNRVSLDIYLNVMESIFKALRDEDPKLHDATIDFQERHVQEMAKKLG